MNKAFIGILIAVCILGMALIMLNEWKSSKNDPEPASPALEASPATLGELPPHPARAGADARSRTFRDGPRG